MFLLIHSSLGAPLTTARREPPAEAAEEVGDLGTAEDGGDVEAVSEDMVGLSPAAGQGRGVAEEAPHTCVRRDGVGRSVGELEVRAVRIVNVFCCDGRCRGRQLICQLLAHDAVSAKPADSRDRNDVCPAKVVDRQSRTQS